jgi:hypothetical protein
VSLPEDIVRRVRLKPCLGVCVAVVCIREGSLLKRRACQGGFDMVRKKFALTDATVNKLSFAFAFSSLL